MTANIGGDDIKGNPGSLRSHMGAFDALPERIRQFARTMSINWNGADIAAVVASHGEDVCLAMLQKTEADMQAAHRAKIAAALRVAA